YWSATLFSADRSLVFTRTYTTESYTLSLHDALPILLNETEVNLLTSTAQLPGVKAHLKRKPESGVIVAHPNYGGTRSSSAGGARSEEHTSELQSRENLVCRLLLEKKKTN